MARLRRRPISAVSIATSDSGGGAGIQADLLTFAAHGIHGTSVLVGATAQDTRRITAIEAFSPSFIRAQIDAVFSDFRPRSVKIGALLDATRVRAVASALARQAAPNVVVDPVLISSSGVRLLSPSALSVFAREILPLCDLATPNRPEAQILSGVAIRGPRDLARAADRIAALGARAVLIKGGHARGGTVRDILFFAGRVFEFSHPRIPTGATHGTGCTLSAAIAANLALGRRLPDAVERSIAYVVAGLQRGVFPGRGRGVPDHFPRARGSAAVCCYLPTATCHL